MNSIENVLPVVNADILIIGAGPAGLAAAASASDSGLQIHIIDDNFDSGGQIWRGGAGQHKNQRARDLWKQLNQFSNVTFHFQSKVVLAQKIENCHLKIIVESAGKSRVFITKKLIIATGARELLLPFPGWTSPGVTGAGGLQALTKNGFPVSGKRIVIAGSGPLLLAVADSLIQRGAIVTHIIEQTSLIKLAQFSFGLLKTPHKLLQALSLWKNLRKIPYWSNSYVTSAHGEATLRSVTVHRQGKPINIECDYLACGYGLIPNIELAAALQCEIVEDGITQTVHVNDRQETSQQNIYCAGEGTGIGGVDLALAEGHIAGYFASSTESSPNIIDSQKMAPYVRAKDNGKRFSLALQTRFELRPELRQLCNEDTIVCRCEDVPYQALQQHQDWRSAKLHTRCGMGACQGKICGAANRYLFSWDKDHGRLPLANANIASLLLLEETTQDTE